MVWKGYPFVSIMMLAGLQSIPEDFYHAARVDGANAWQRLVNITLPCLMPVLGVTLVLVDALGLPRLLDHLRADPGRAAQGHRRRLSIMTYEQAFGFFKMGYASAIGVVTLVICVVAAPAHGPPCLARRCTEAGRDEAHAPPDRLPSTPPSFVTCVLVLFPIYWMFVTALSPANQLRSFPPVFWPPRSATGTSSGESLHRTPVRCCGSPTRRSPPSAPWRFSMRSAILAGYSLSRFRVRGGHSLGLFILTAKMLPATLLVIPLFGIFREVDLIGSLWSIILAHATLIVPFRTWMLKGYFDTIPTELEQAAMVDGCSPLGALVRVILPVALPASPPRRSMASCSPGPTTPMPAPS